MFIIIVFVVIEVLIWLCSHLEAAFFERCWVTLTVCSIISSKKKPPLCVQLLKGLIATANRNMLRAGTSDAGLKLQC